jgi:sorting nexin-13
MTEMTQQMRQQQDTKDNDNDRMILDAQPTHMKLFMFLIALYAIALIMSSFSDSIVENLPKALGTLAIGIITWKRNNKNKNTMSVDSDNGNGFFSRSNNKNKNTINNKKNEMISSDEEDETTINDNNNNKSIEDGIIAKRKKNNNRRARRFAKLDNKIVESWIKMREVVIKRYINYWFKTLSDDEEVPNACRAVMDDAFLELEKRASRNINLPKILLSELPAILSDAFELYREGKALIGGGDDDALLSMDKDVVDESLADALRHQRDENGKPRLHPAVRDEKKQRRLCRAYASTFASKVLSDETKNGLTEPLSREFIVASIHMPMVRLCTPKYITKLLLILLGTDDDLNSSNSPSYLEDEKKEEENNNNRSAVAERLVATQSPAASNSKKKKNLVVNWAEAPAASSPSLLRARVTGVEITGSGMSAFAVYLVSVETDENNWIVPRRYSNFESLHQKLAMINPDFKGYFPGKNWGYNNLDGAFIEKRRYQLDLYLKDILSDEVLKDCEEIFHFLSTRNKNFIQRESSDASSILSTEMKPIMLLQRQLPSIRTTTQGGNWVFEDSNNIQNHRRILSIEQMELLDSPPKHSKSGVINSFQNQLASPLNWETLMRTFDETDNSSDNISTVFASEVLNGPMLGLFETVFQMHTKGLMRRSFVAMARQTVEFFLGSAVEDFVSRSFNQLQASFLINLIKDAVWPDEKEGGLTSYDKFKLSLTPEEEKKIDEQNKEMLRRVLLTRLSQKLSPIVGESTASRGTLELFSLLQSHTMCQHVGLLLFETLSVELVPESVLSLL